MNDVMKHKPEANLLCDIWKECSWRKEVQYLYVLVRMYQVCSTSISIEFTGLRFPIVHKFAVNVHPVEYVLISMTKSTEKYIIR